MSLAGCGGGHESTVAASRPALGLRSHTAANRTSARGTSDARVSRSRALAFARAVNLTAADVPGATATPNDEHEGSGREFSRCGGAGNQPKVAHASSPKLSRGSGLEAEEITSGVTVYSSAATVRRDFAAVRNERARACVARLLQKRFVGKSIKGSHVSSIQLTRLPVSAPADETVALRVSIRFVPNGAEVSVPVYFDVVGLASGPAEVTLTAMSIVQPVPEETERQLTELLAGRARANTL